MIGLYDKYNNLITKLVDSAVSTPDVIEIKNRTLDGKYHIQTIGTSATTLQVQVALTKDQKKIVDDIKRTSDLIKVVFDGEYFIGVIDGKLDPERLKFPDGPMFKMSFTLLVSEEGVAV